MMPPSKRACGSTSSRGDVAADPVGQAGGSGRYARVRVGARTRARSAALRRAASLLALSLLSAGAGRALAAPAAPPRYDHVFVIIEENKDYEEIMQGPNAPNIQRLAREYGQATEFFSEVHPSEANYVALLGGDTFGIHDDDAYYCRPKQADPFCPHASEPDYPSHTVDRPHLGDQLERAGLDWKGYYEDLPRPGSEAVTAGAVETPEGLRPVPLYASKHSGFMNFRSTQLSKDRARRIVGFDALEADLKADRLPAFALIIPNQCDEMHGVSGPGLPPGCEHDDVSGLIRRGDQETARLVAKIQATPTWRSRGNVAIVISFDEGAGKKRGGCCSVTPDAPSNFGGGHIPMVVVTNHGPRGIADPTPYNHYSLLRTLEDMFGLPEHLERAADTAHGVVDMTPLFATSPRG